MNIYLGRAEHRLAISLGEQIEKLVKSANDVAMQMLGCFSQGVSRAQSRGTRCCPRSSGGHSGFGISRPSPPRACPLPSSKARGCWPLLWCFWVTSIRRGSQIGEACRSPVGSEMPPRWQSCSAFSNPMDSHYRLANDTPRRATDSVERAKVSANIGLGTDISRPCAGGAGQAQGATRAARPSADAIEHRVCVRACRRVLAWLADVSATA